MIPIRTPHSNAVFVAPGCSDLPAELCDDGRVATVWELDDAERAAIAAGGVVALTFYGGRVPPVSLEVESALPHEVGASHGPDTAPTPETLGGKA